MLLPDPFGPITARYWPSKEKRNVVDNLLHTKGYGQIANIKKRVHIKAAAFTAASYVNKYYWSAFFNTGRLLLNREIRLSLFLNCSFVTLCPVLNTATLASTAWATVFAIESEVSSILRIVFDLFSLALSIRNLIVAGDTSESSEQPLNAAK